MVVVVVTAVVAHAPGWEARRPDVVQVIFPSLVLLGSDKKRDSG